MADVKGSTRESVARRIGRELRAIENKTPASILGHFWSWFNKRDFIQFGLRYALARWRIAAVSLPETKVAADQPLAITVLRDGMPWLTSFLEHHRRLGIRRFVVLDNGSSDGSQDFLAAQPDVLLLTSRAPYRHYENTFKRYLCNRYGMNRWCLFVDVDELLYYPAMERRPLVELTDFAEGQGFEAVVTQMLDMHSALPLAELPDSANADLLATFPLFDTSDVQEIPFPADLRPEPPAGLFRMTGGVRMRVFGTNNGLTKVSLFRNRKGLSPFLRWHLIGGARLADFSIALLHFPFTRQFRAKAMEAAASGRYGWKTSAEYRAYAKVLQDHPACSLAGPGSQRLIDPRQLYENGFLRSSRSFEEWQGVGQG